MPTRDNRGLKAMENSPVKVTTKRILTLAVASGLAIGMLSGCGGGAADATPIPTAVAPPQQQQTQITSGGYPAPAPLTPTPYPGGTATPMPTFDPYPDD